MMLERTNAQSRWLVFRCPRGRKPRRLAVELRDPEGLAGSNRSGQETRHGHRGQPAKKILVADGERAVRRLVRATLRKLDYLVFEAATLSETIAIARSIQPDLVLLDVTTVQEAAEDERTIRGLRRQNPRKPCVVVWMTTHRQNREPVARPDSGADYVLEKPFSPIRLRQLIGVWLGV